MDKVVMLCGSHGGDSQYGSGGIPNKARGAGGSPSGYGGGGTGNGDSSAIMVVTAVVA